MKGRGCGSDRTLWFPLGIVGPGGSPGSRPEPSAPDSAQEEGEGVRPRRFVVPRADREPRSTSAPSGAETVQALRRIVREGGLLLGADQTSLFLFGSEGAPVRRVVRYRLAERLFEAPDRHPPRMAREVRALLSSVSRAEVTDVRQNAPPPGAMRDYLAASNIKGLLSLPIRREGRIVGFLAFESMSGPRRWTPRDRDRAHEVTRRIEETLDGEFLSQVERGDPLPGADWTAGTQDVRDVGEGGTVKGRFMEPRAKRRIWSDPERDAEARPIREGSRELRARLPRLRTLEGAAVVSADLGAELLELVHVQEGTLRLLDEVIPDAGEGRDILDDLRELTHRMGLGLRTVLDVTRRGMVGHDVEDLNRVLGGLIHRLARLVGEDVRFVVSPCVDALPVRASPRLLERALEQVIRNAREAVRRGGRIRMSWDVVRLAEAVRDPAERQDFDRELVRIRIEDDGPGIRTEYLPWVFEPFFTSASGPEGRGRGMGLALVQAVVEGHGGWVDLHSRLGEGTQVTLYLPLARDPVSHAAEDEGVPEPEEEEGEGGSGPPRILLVEDQSAVARLLDRVLTRAGFQVEVAGSAARARRLWTEGEGGFDLVLVECQMGAGEAASPLIQEWRRERADLAFLILDRRGDPEATAAPGGDPSLVISDPFDPLGVVRRVRQRLRPPEPDSRDESPDPPSVPPSYPGQFAH